MVPLSPLASVLRRGGDLLGRCAGGARVVNPPRPKTVLPLDPDTREALRQRVEASSARAAGRALLVSDSLVRRALDGAPITQAIHRLLSLQLQPTVAAP